MGDGGTWLRRQCLLMAQANNTPVPFWLSLPLWQLKQWIEDSNWIINERKKH
ncbi:MAG: hypothetical protein ACI4AL_06145 [Aristaeellaceae bacterium]